MIEILEKWNRWGSGAPFSGKERNITSKLIPYLERKEVLALLGPRRSGKSTIMYQLIDHLEASGVNQESVLHINFEEPLYADKLSIETLESLYTAYRERINPTGFAYLFLDEIQNIPQWEKWVRSRTETENIKIILTGSSASLLSSELSTVLTGRHFAFTIYPLNFAEFLSFKNIQPPKKNLINAPHEIAFALNEYLTWGGYPEVVLTEDTEIKEKLLSQYLDDTLYKDVAMRFEVRDISTLRALAVHLLTQSATLVSNRRIANLFSISPERAQNYCRYLEQAFLVSFLPYFSLKVGERNRNPEKVYAIDNGFRQILAVSQTADTGRKLESTVYQELLRRHKAESIYYWKGKQEVDFLIYEQQVSRLIQVTDQIEQEDTLKRELQALEEAQRSFPKTACELISTSKLSKQKNQSDFKLTQSWHFLLYDFACEDPSSAK